MAHTDDQLITVREVAARMGVARETIYRIMAKTALRFPQGVRVGARARRWDRAEVEAWIASRRIETENAMQT